MQNNLSALSVQSPIPGTPFGAMTPQNLQTVSWKPGDSPQRRGTNDGSDGQDTPPPQVTINPEFVALVDQLERQILESLGYLQIASAMHMRSGKDVNILVHCIYGQNRSVAVTIAYAMMLSALGGKTNGTEIFENLLKRMTILRGRVLRGRIFEKRRQFLYALLRVRDRIFGGGVRY